MTETYDDKRPLAVIERPGMKPYRARKQPAGFFWDDPEYSYNLSRYGATIMRTHDVERATVLARRLFDCHRGSAGEYPLPEPQLTWFRFAPWGCETVSPSVRGAVPCVYFEHLHDLRPTSGQLP